MEETTPSTILTLADIIILGRLGRGATSHVFRAQSSRNKQLYAMKVIDKKASNYDPLALKRQLSIHRSLNHLQIAKLISHIQDSDNHYVLTEYCEGGELTRLLAEPFSESKLAIVALQLVQGVLQLHRNGVAHCDLKLSNLLLHRGLIKICDFGFSQLIDQSQKGNSLFGTLNYMAPQVLREKQRIHLREADVWAIGICLFILVTRKQPYSGTNFQQIRKQILNAERETLPAVSNELKDMLEKLLQMDPIKRIRLEDVLTHPFLKKHHAKIQKGDQLQIQSGGNNITMAESVANETVQKLHSETEAQSEKEEGNDYEFVRRPQRKYKNGQIKSQKKIQGQLIKRQNEPRKTFIRPSELKQEGASSKEWSFKRTPIKNEIDIDSTMERKTSVQPTGSDNDETVRIAKPSKDTLNSFVKVQARLVHPLSDFYYETKNEGFIKIMKNGDLQIKIKGIQYQIIEKGQKLKLNDKTYCFKDLQQNGKNGSNKQPYELYEYAISIIQIFTAKKYSKCWVQQFDKKDIVLGLTKDKKKLLALTNVNQRGLLIQCSLQNESVRTKTEGEKWSAFNVQNQQMEQTIQYIRSRILSLFKN